MNGSMKSWWEAKGKKGQKGFVGIVIAVALMAAYAILVSVMANIAPGTPFASQTRLGAPFLGNWDDSWPRILGTVYYFSLIIAIGTIIRGIIFVCFIKTENKVKTVTRLISSAIKYAAALVFVFVCLSVWGVDGSAILVSAGVIALVIGLGAQSLISDIIAGLNIVFESEYEVGDFVLIDSFRGQIEEIGLTTTKLVDGVGNVKIINNSKIQTVVNLSKNPSVAYIDVGVEYGENIESIEAILKEELPLSKDKYPVFLDEPIYNGVSGLADSSVNLRFQVLCAEADRFAAERCLYREVYIIFQRHNINIPYPQVTISNRE